MNANNVDPSTRISLSFDEPIRSNSLQQGCARYHAIAMPSPSRPHHIPYFMLGRASAASQGHTIEHTIALASAASRHPRHGVGCLEFTQTALCMPYIAITGGITPQPIVVHPTHILYYGRMPHSIHATFYPCHILSMPHSIHATFYPCHILSMRCIPMYCACAACGVPCVRSVIHSPVHCCILPCSGGCI